jgi:trypsin
MIVERTSVPKVAPATAGIVALLASTSLSAQVTVDAENRYPNVGTIMFWRVDDSGKPIELRGFASGTLIRDRVMVTAGHVTGPATALGGMPPSVRAFVSFSPSDAKDPKTWIPVVRQTSHPSMPVCPPPPQCDPTDDILVAPLQPGIADVGLIFLEQAPEGIERARFVRQGTLERSEGMQTTIVGYGTTIPRKDRSSPVDVSTWDGKRRIRTSTVRRVVDETWALWSIPSYVCSGDSGGAIFLNVSRDRNSGDDELVANVSDGGRDCRRQNNNNRLDTDSIQKWINDTIASHR